MGSNGKALGYFVYFGRFGGPGQVLDQYFTPFEDADLFGARQLSIQDRRRGPCLMGTRSRGIGQICGVGTGKDMEQAV
jgi:hypothetical protein